MRFFLPLVLALTPWVSQSQPPSAKALRCAYARLLLEQTAAGRTINHKPLGALKVEACGLDGSILYIHDDSDDAKIWFDGLDGDVDIRNTLASYGFTVAVLINKKHGTFVFQLLEDGPSVHGSWAA